ncbi:MAG: serine/threonine protein kinase, partial [Deltaproteobacteria bacterium]|nr:serine/threonine protein kinase [Deltaproteobacteria bacterium]
MGEGRQGRVRARTVKPGSFLGHYEILEPLAKGGMAEVFLARDSHGGKLVVLKRGLAEMMEQDDLASMFYDEARLVSMFSHPNIVRTYDARAAAAEHYYVMEYLDGLDCQQLLHRVARAGHSIPLAVSVNLMIRLADALHYAHELCDENGKPLNIVHRDISPGNLRLTLDGQVKLLDFGVAAAALEERTVTRVGQVKGKLTYMAPEQLAGSYDRRSDIFSLGVVLYELSTLTRFFGASKLVVEDRFGFKGAEKPTSIVPDYPPELEAIVMKATASNPAHRYQTAAELGRKLVDFVVANEMRLSDEVLADFIIKLVELEKDPVEEPPPAELTVRA